MTDTGQYETTYVLVIATQVEAIIYLTANLETPYSYKKTKAS
jgi:hypothetical protein